MLKAFEFTDANRHYSCTVETLKGTDEAWWWFAVSQDAQRYAPFRAEDSDTRVTVRERVVAFYTNRLFQLAQPPRRGAQFGSRLGRPPAAPAGSATPAAGAAEPVIPASDDTTD
jgi:hypothetical protein